MESRCGSELNSPFLILFSLLLFLLTLTLLLLFPKHPWGAVITQQGTADVAEQTMF